MAMDHLSGEVYGHVAFAVFGCIVGFVIGLVVATRWKLRA